MTNILLTCDLNASTNYGTAAQIVSFCKTLNLMSNKLHIILFSLYPKIDRPFYSRYGISVPFHPLKGDHLLLSLMKYLPKIMHTHKSGNGSDDVLLDVFTGADVVIDFSGDAITDLYDSDRLPLGLVTDMIPIIMPLCFKKPVILFSQSIGPFRKKSYPLARFLLDKTKAIFVRDRYSYEYIKAMRISPRIIQSADVAFLLEAKPSSNKILKTDNRPLVGISVSAFLGESFKNYRGQMAGLLKYVIRDFDANVAFIPNVIDPYSDGRLEARQICALVPELEDRITRIESELSLEEKNALIGECDLFIASRMHAAIAALSANIPTITIGSHFKFRMLMERLGLAELSIDPTSNLSELIFKVKMAWKDRDVIRKHLEKVTTREKESALHSVALVAEMIRGLR